MASLETLQKIYTFCNKAADLVREAEGSTDPIPLNELRTRLANANIAKFDIANNKVQSHMIVYGAADPITPTDDVDCLRKTFTNFANKVRTGSEKFDINQLINKEDSVCGAHIDAEGKYGIRIPDGVTSIGNAAFHNCYTLTSVTIPDSVTSIEQDAFLNCHILASVIIPDSVVSIGQDAFKSCPFLTGTTLDGAVYLGNTENEYIYLLKIASQSITSCNIADGCKFIGGPVFRNCYTITSVTIPDSITSISEAIFEHCTSLVSVTIGRGITSIPSSAFGSCSNLPSITIPDSITSIGESAFQYCHSLTSIDIPDSVTSIGSQAFEHCLSLSSITIPSSVKEIGGSAFMYSGLNDIYYDGSVDECKNSGIDWFSALSNTSLTVVHCTDGDYEVGGGGGSGSGSGSGDGSDY